VERLIPNQIGAAHAKKPPRLMPKVRNPYSVPALELLKPSDQVQVCNLLNR